MPIITHPYPTHRACAWCANEYPITRRPGRPRLYCNHTCRQRAYEHRHGFTHQRTTRPLPGQTRGETWTGTGYERSYTGLFPGNGQVHAMRTSIRPERHRRETLCGLLAPPLPGRHFTTNHQRACKTCTTITTNNPLHYGINPSNELATIRALLDETREHRINPTDTINWITTNNPLAAYWTGQGRSRRVEPQG